MISKVISLAATSAFVGVEALQHHWGNYHRGSAGAKAELARQHAQAKRAEFAEGKYTYKFTHHKEDLKGCCFKKTVYTLNVCLKESGELKNQVGPLEKKQFTVFVQSKNVYI